MEGLCLVGVFLLFVIAWIYDEISKQVKGSNNSSRNSASTSKPVNRSKRGECRYYGAVVIVDEMPDSHSREAIKDFVICEVCHLFISIKSSPIAYQQTCNASKFFLWKGPLLGIPKFDNIRDAHWMNTFPCISKTFDAR